MDLCTRDPNGNLSRMTYDPSESFVVQSEDALHRVSRRTHFEPDHLDEDLYGQLRTFTDANQNTLQQEFDSFGRKTRIAFPDGRWLTYAYEDVGDPQQQRIVTTRSGGLTTASYFDGLGRAWLQQESGADGKIIDFRTEVDARGLVIRSFAPYFHGDTPTAAQLYSEPKRTK